MSWWFWAGLAAAAYCIVRGVLDLRARAYAWGVLGVLAGLVILSTPTTLRILSIKLPVTVRATH